MMYSYIMEIFFVIGMASAIFAISLVLYSAIFFDRPNKAKETISKIP